MDAVQEACFRQGNGESPVPGGFRNRETWLMTMMRAAPLAAILALGAASSSARAAANDFDGTWQFTLTCSANTITRQPGYTERFTAEVNEGAFRHSRATRPAEGPPQLDRWQGSVQNGRMAVLVESQRGSQRWMTRLEGAAVSPVQFELQGGTFVSEDRQVRSCQLSASLTRPAPQSLAATALTRMAQVAAVVQELTNRLAVAQQDMERLRAEAQQTEDRLQTELDFARFEGNAMRTELDQRAQQAAQAAQQIAALTARATQAEQAAQAAAARAAQAEAAATAARAEAAQVAQARDAAAARAAQAEAAAAAARAEAAQAAQARDAAAARAAQAEAAAAAARAEAAQAAQARDAAAARAAQAEAAAAAARTEAAQAAAQAREAAERAARAEAAAATLRAELEQARRALAEAQAAPPAPRQ